MMSAGRRTANGRSAHDENRLVAHVDHLVRGASQHQPGKVTPPAGPHHDDVHVMLTRGFDDIAGGMPEHRVLDHPVRLESRRVQLIYSSLDALGCLIV